MIKNISKITAALCLVSTLSLCGCTSHFESDNQDKTAFTDELQEYDFQKYLLKFEIIQSGIYFNYNWGSGKNWPFQIMQNLGQDMFSGYFHDMNNAFNDKNSTYAINDGWTSSHWSNTYKYIMPEITKCEEINANQPGLLGITKILKVETMHRIADVYGPIVYTKFGQEGDNIDTQADAYKAFFSDIDKGIELIQDFMTENPQTEPFKDADLLMPIGKRTLGQWLKFANSLRLRLAIRVSNADKTLAQAEITKAFNSSIGFLESSDETVAVSTGNGKYTNPLGEINMGWSEVYMGATMESLLNGYNDPRADKFYQKAVGGNITWKDDNGEKSLNELFPICGTFKGIPQGTGLTTADNRYRLHSRSTVTTTTDAILMTAAEVWFLRSEAALRGLSTENAKACYEAGIKTSFQQWGVSGADMYLMSHNTPANYIDAFNSQYNMNARITTTPNWDDATTPEEQLEKIATQKWLACYPEGNEAWSEQRRTGYPKLFRVQQNNSGGKIDTEIMIRRLPFPASLIKDFPTQYSAMLKALGGADNGGTRLWWDTGKNNF